MTRNLDVDQLLESWLAEGPSQLPDRVVDSIVRQLDQARPRTLRWPLGWVQIGRSIWAIAGIAAAVLLIAVGVALFGGLAVNNSGPAGPPTISPSPAPPSYEAVFLRRDPSDDVIVIGVDRLGRERVIRRLAQAWSGSKPPTPAPAGVLSPSGLLVMASGVEPMDVRWTIFDVLRAAAAPVLVPGIAPQDTDQLDYFLIDSRTTGRDARPWWGPNDRLAIYWYERIPQGGKSFGRNYFITFADGKTGETTNVDVPDDMVFRPYWAPDGSGIFAETVDGPQVLRPDGTLVVASDPIPEPSCSSLPPGSGDAGSGRPPVSCTSPDDSIIVTTAGDIGSPTSSVSVQASGDVFEVAGNFAGWLRSDQ